MAGRARRSQSQMASTPPRLTLSRVGLPSSGDPGPAHRCLLMIRPCRKTGWSSSSPCYQAPLQRPAQTCYAPWAATCSHLPDPRSVGSSAPASHLPPGSSSGALCPQHGTHSKNARKASVQHPGPIVLCLLHLAHHPCTGRCNGPASKCGYSVVGVRARGEQGAGPPGERAPQTPHQAPGCRARKRRGDRVHHRPRKSQPSAVWRRHHKGTSWLPQR